MIKQILCTSPKYNYLSSQGMIKRNVGLLLKIK